MFAGPESNARKHKGSHTSHNASQDKYLPGGVLIAEVAPLDQNFPAGARQAGAAAYESAGLGPSLLHQHAGLAVISPLEVDDLALGNAHEQGLRHPFVVDVGLAYPLHQVLCLLPRAWHDSKPLLGTGTGVAKTSGVEVEMLNSCQAGGRNCWVANASVLLQTIVRST